MQKPELPEVYSTLFSAQTDAIETLQRTQVFLQQTMELQASVIQTLINAHKETESMFIGEDLTDVPEEEHDMSLPRLHPPSQNRGKPDDNGPAD